MSRAGTTATLERPDERTDRDLLSAALLAPTRGSPASSSHSLLISSNLRAALEFEERIRTPLPGSPNRAGSISAAGGTADWGGGPQQGLPPPPRPKSRPTKAAHAHASQSYPAGPVSSPASPVSAPQATDGSSAGANPYINPVPQLSHLIREEPPLVMGDQQQADTQSIGHGSNDSHGTGSSRASPTVSSASPSPSTGGKPESPRHIRGLSSLQKMEKMIGKSKKMLVEGNLKLPGGRRAVDASRVGSGELGRRTKAASVLYASSAPSSPISAVSVSLGGMRRVESGQRAASTGEGKPAAVATGGRGGDSHGVGGTAEGAGSWTPITDSEPSPRPISISSTIYPSSTRSFTPPSRSLASRPAMNDHRESFIELASPTFSPTDARATFASFRDEQRPPQQRDSLFPDEFSSHPYASTKPLLAPLSTGKPPIPTSAKPDFSSRRSKSAQRTPVEEPSPNTPSPSEPSPDYERGLRNRPSTSNLLQPHERADLVRKTRKLTQLFGQTPGVGHYPVEVDFGRGHAARTNLVGAVPHPSRRRKHKPAASMLDDPIVPVYDAQKRVVWPPAEEGQYASAGARRRSVPLSPAEYSAVGSALSVSVGGHVIEIGSAEGTAAWSEGSGASGGSENSHADLAEREASGSPESFIDLSDEEDPAAFPDSRSPATPKGYLLPPRSDSLLSPSTPSLDALSLSSEQLAEEDRRRKRERLAKLHRFLGSRVPAHLVLGPLEEGVPLPPPASPSPQDDMYGEDADARKLRLRRRRSSSAAEFAGTWSDEIDRLKEDLNDREKAINVRRAVKMEKMFGVAPPQVLYHTRQAVSSPGSSSVSPATPKSKHSPQSSAAQLLQQSGASPAPTGRNPNQAAYKGKSKKGARPGTAESTEPLLDRRAPSSDNWDDGVGLGHTLTALSDVYLHYRHSLNSLNDIIDRDDRQSLAELHDYLSGRGHDTGEDTPTEESVFTLAHAQTKAERRRSMPTRTSMTSIASEWTVLPSPPPEESAFQQRRRRAAKLTQFFGVNYRDLMNEILESIEKGLEEERGRGTMQPDEIQDLMQKLRRLKTKRNNWP